MKNSHNFWKIGITLIIALPLIALSSLAYSAKNSQDDPIALLLQKLKAWTKKTNIEKVHLHLDKTHYNLGDHIWFKAIVTEFETLAPTEQSEVLYVDLFDENDSLSNKAIIRLNTGVGQGQFFLPDTLNEGNYRIRAYTRWMQNAGPEYYFSKSLKVSAPINIQTAVQTKFLTEVINNAESTKAIITIKNSLDQALINLKVGYQLLQNGKTITRGNITSDKNGELSITIPSSNLANQNLGQIKLKYEQYNRTYNQVIPIPLSQEKQEIQFFPESGHLVANLTNKVAFKAVNGNGKGTFVSGEIIDENGSQVTTFESTHLGMGSFFLLPIADKTYKARVKFSDKDIQTIALPKIEKSGYTIQVKNANGLATGYHKTGQIQINILQSEELVGKEKLYLIAHQNGRESFSTELSSQKTTTLVNLSVADMNSGISTVTLLNGDFIPLAERLIYVNNPIDFMDLKALNIKSAYSKKEKMDLNFNALMGQGLTDASFSVSVTNSISYIPDSLNESNIYSSLLLESDIRGLVENPNYYFENLDDSRIKALDHLLLTQGWRKLDWTSIAQNKTPSINYNVQKNLEINGNITSKSNEKFKVVLLTKNFGLAIDTMSSTNGDFSFNKLDFIDSTLFMFQARNSTNKAVGGLKINKPITTNLLNSEKLNKEINYNNWDNIINQRIKYNLEYEMPSQLKGTIGLKEVEIKQIAIAEPPIRNSSNLNGAGRADVVLSVKDFGVGQTVRDILFAKAGSFMMQNRETGHIAVTQPIIVVDGVPIEFEPRDPQRYLDLLEQRLDYIGSIEVLKSPSYTSMYGARGLNGVILINTRSALDIPQETSSSSLMLRYLARGYQLPKVFYEGLNKNENNNQKDNRTTVYWNPSVLSDKEGNIKFSYTNTDEKGIYRIVIEGINLNGELLRKVYHYRVN